MVKAVYTVPSVAQVIDGNQVGLALPSVPLVFVLVWTRVTLVGESVKTDGLPRPRVPCRKGVCHILPHAFPPPLFTSLYWDWT